MRMGRLVLHKAVIDQDREAARRAAGINVTPTIADEIAGREIDAVLGRRGEQQAGLRLAAVAVIRIGVKTDPDIVNRQPPPQFGMHGIDGCAWRDARRHVRLVGRDDRHKAGFFRALNRLFDAGEEPEFLKRPRRIRMTIADKIGVKHAVTIQKNRALRHRHDGILVKTSMARRVDKHRGSLQYPAGK
jgi:hypothetical protein